MSPLQILHILLLIFLSKTSLAQDERVINYMAKKHQACFDKGVDMLGCSVRYYRKMDSMLNVVYNNLRARVISKDKGVIKKEQIEWLKKRDNFFKKQDKFLMTNLGKENGDQTWR